MNNWIYASIISFVFGIIIFFGQREFKKELPLLLEQWRKDRLTSYKSKMKKIYTKYKDTKDKLEVEEKVGKENIQFNVYENANERIKMLIETFCETYEIDISEFEKQIFCLAYERGYADGQYDFKNSLMEEE